jgi:probable F420-dependent oxidoreductase
MHFGTGFPMVALPGLHQVRDFAQTVEGAGYNYVTTAGHFLSTEPDRYPERPKPLFVGPYHEPMVLFSYLSGVTTTLEFLTGILILPLFPAALVAKQAAELSFVSGGRFHLGVAISWNPYEYEAMGQDIHTRGARLEEQISVMRRLWAEPFVRFEGRFHKLDGVGLNRPLAHPIPIWMGSGVDEKMLRRVARLADGWLPNVDPEEPIARLRGYLADEKRDPAAFRFGGRLSAANDDPAEWVAAAKRLQGIGVTHISVGGPAGVPLSSLLDRLTKVRRALAAELGM